jgi:5-methylcytosine-specific restriction enzyme A
MSRYFSKAVQRERLQMAGYYCEAEGPLYGFDEGHQCYIDLRISGVEFDHWDLYANSRDSSLENCRAVCPRCHAFKTAKHDTPKAAKTLRQQDKHRGIKKPPGRKIKSRGFQKPYEPEGR